MKLTLKAARANKGLTQKEAAEQIGISLSTLKNYEQNKSYPDVPIIEAIERAYGVRYEEIIFLPQNYPLRVKNNDCAPISDTIRLSPIVQRST